MARTPELCLEQAGPCTEVIIVAGLHQDQQPLSGVTSQAVFYQKEKQAKPLKVRCGKLCHACGQAPHSARSSDVP